MPIVKMPDGALVEVPDNPTPEQRAALQAILEKTAQAAAPAPKEEVLGLGETARVVGKSLYGGLTTLPRFVMQAGDWLEEKMPTPEWTKVPIPAYKELSAADQAIREAVEPKTKTGKVIGNIGEAAVGAVASPGGMAAPFRSALIGASSGAGSEASAAAFGDNALTRILGGLAGGLTGGFVTAAKTNRGTLAREALADVRPEDLAVAVERMKAARDAGIPINLSQAMPRASNIDAYVDALANSKHGRNVTEQLRKQPQQIAFGVEEQIANLPGQIRMPQVLANNAQEAATTAIEIAKQNRTAAWQKAFETELARLQQGPKIALAEAQALAAKAADQLAAAQAADAKALAARAAMERAAAVKQSAEKQALEKALAAPPPIPAGIGSRQGVLLTDSERGQRIIDALATWEAQQAMLRGQGSIVGLDGKPLQQAAKVFEPPPLPPVELQAPAAQAALTEAQKRSIAAGLALQGTEAVPAKAMQRVYQYLTDLAASNPNTTAEKLLLELREKLVTPDGYLTDARQINDVLKDFANGLKPVNLSTKGVDAGVAKWVGGKVAGIRDMLGESFEPFKKANEVYRVHTESIVDPLKKSVVGRIAGRAGAQDAIEAPQARLFSVFEKGTVPGATSSEILTLEKAFRNAGQPEVFQDAAKSWIAGKVSAALKSTDNRMPENIGERLRVAFGDPRQLDQTSKGFEDVLAGLARSQGVPEAPYVKGFKHFMEIVSDAARRPGSVRGVTPGEVKDMASEGVFKRLGQVSVMTPIRQPALKWASFLEADALSTMDKLLTSPEGVATLIKLGKQPPYSHAAISTMATFLGTNAAAQGGETNPPGITAE